MKILLLVDVQNGFVRTAEVDSTVNKIQSLLELKIFDSVIATRFLNANHSTYETILGWHRLTTREEQELDSRIAPYVDCILDKYGYSCVNPSFIQKLIQLNGGTYPNEIYIAGIDTDCCVLTSAAALFDVGIKPIVLIDYCNSNGGKKSHDSGITCMQRLIGHNQIINDLPPVDAS